MSSFKLFVLLILTFGLTLAPMNEADAIPFQRAWKATKNWWTSRKATTNTAPEHANPSSREATDDFVEELEEAAQEGDEVAEELLKPLRRIDDPLVRETGNFAHDLNLAAGHPLHPDTVGMDDAVNAMEDALGDPNVDVILVAGEKGSGKSQLLEGALKDIQKKVKEGSLEDMVDSVRGNQAVDINLGSNDFKNFDSFKTKIETSIFNLTRGKDQQKFLPPGAPLIVRLKHSRLFTADEKAKGYVDIEAIIAELQSQAATNGHPLKIVVEANMSQADTLLTRQLLGDSVKVIQTPPALADDQRMLLLKEFAKLIARETTDSKGIPLVTFSDKALREIDKNAMIFYADEGVPAGQIKLMREVARRRARLVQMDKTSKFSDHLRREKDPLTRERRELKRIVQRDDRKGGKGAKYARRRLVELDEKIPKIDKKIRKADTFWRKIQKAKSEQEKIIAAAQEEGRDITEEEYKTLQRHEKTLREASLHDIALVLNDPPKRIKFTEVLDEQEVLSMEELSKLIGTYVFGQQRAIDEIVQSLKRLDEPDPERVKPAGFPLLVGPTGTGKTEILRVIARVRGMGWILEDMTRNAGAHSDSNLRGSAPGLVGYDIKNWIDHLAARPDSMIVLDEIDKAHYNALVSVLNDFDTGIAKNNQGVTATMGRAFPAATANWANEYLTPDMTRDEIVSTIRAFVLEKKGIDIPPEFFERFSDIIVFDKHTEDSITKIFGKKIQAMEEKLCPKYHKGIVVDDLLVERYVDYAMNKGTGTGRAIMNRLDVMLDQKVRDAMIHGFYEVRNVDGTFSRIELPEIEAGDDMRLILKGVDSKGEPVIGIIKDEGEVAARQHMSDKDNGVQQLMDFGEEFNN